MNITAAALGAGALSLPRAMLGPKGDSGRDTPTMRMMSQLSHYRGAELEYSEQKKHDNRKGLRLCSEVWKHAVEGCATRVLEFGVASPDS